jgi:hypothetical protein
MLNVTYTTLSISKRNRVRLPVESRRIDLDAIVTTRLPFRLPLEKAAEALDSDRVPGTVNSVVTVS